jgi:hypothetical protein
MELAPTIKKLVPWNAVRMRKTKNDARFGASAVPMENAKNKTAEPMHGYYVEIRIRASRTWHRAHTHLLP